MKIPPKNFLWEANIAPHVRMQTMIQIIASVAQDTSKWNLQRRITNCQAELQRLDAFQKGCEHAGKPLPVLFHAETIAMIDQLLAAELARLRNKAAP